MPLRVLLPALLSLATLLSGCASAPLPSHGALPDGPPAGAVHVAPLRRTFTATLEEPLDEEGQRPLFSPPFRLAVDTGPIETRLLTALRERGGFKAVTPMQAPAGALSGELVRAAREGGADLLLEVSLVDAEVGLAEKNGLHALKVVVLIVSSVLLFPAFDPLNWFLPGEDYAVTLHASWRLTDVHSGARVGAGYLESRAVDSFAAFGLGHTRPWFIIGFLRTPGCIDEEEWDEIGQQLIERAKLQLEVDLVKTIEAARHPKPDKAPAGG